MFPWAVLITGVVGVGGTALGAWLNGRAQTKTLLLSLDAEKESARLADKRRIYSQSLSAFGAMLHVMIKHRGAYEPPFKQAKRAVADAEIDRALRVVSDTYSELQLIAPPHIQELATELYHAMIRFVTVSMKEPEEDSDASGKNPYTIGPIQDNLKHAMRADLGETD